MYWLDLRVKIRLLRWKLRSWRRRVIWIDRRFQSKRRRIKDGCSWDQKYRTRAFIKPRSRWWTPKKPGWIWQFLFDREDECWIVEFCYFKWTIISWLLNNIRLRTTFNGKELHIFQRTNKWDLTLTSRVYQPCYWSTI